MWLPDTREEISSLYCPTVLAVRPPSLRCSHTGQVWNLHWLRWQLRESHWMHRHTDLEMPFRLSLGNTVESLRN